MNLQVARRSPHPPTSPPVLSDADFLDLARLVHADFGLSLPIAKKEMVYARLVKRLQTLGLSGFGDYLHLLARPGGAAEFQFLRSALTTNLSHFFREKHHFDTLRDKVLPPLIAAARRGGKLRLWSAGCSAGQEPYSMALTLLDLCPEAANFDIRILATDVDPQIVAKAREGIYAADQIEAIPQPLQRKATEPVAGKPGTFRIVQSLRALVQFADLNLMETWPMSGPFDAIFCRNVAIYFDMPTQARLWDRFADKIRPGGHLFIGHSERLSGPAVARFDLVGINSYLRADRASGIATEG